MDNPVYLGLSIVELSKIIMYVFWYDYVKPEFGEKAKLCYMEHRGTTLNTSLVFITQSSFAVLKNIPPNQATYEINKLYKWKINSKEMI